MSEKEYKVDRAELKAMTFKEAEDHVTYWENKTECEKLNAACFIINQIFKTTPFDKVDVNFIDKRKHPNGWSF